MISIQAWVRTGSANESKGEEGISHFIEHLVFKGTEKYKVGEVAKLVEGAGGELNAYTSFDQTVFYVTLSMHQSTLGLEALSQMLQAPLFDPEEVENEREVVIEEIRRGKDSQGRRASQLLFSAAYKGHPYERPVIGYEKNVKSWPVKKIKDYYFKRYSPSNMYLVVTGSFDVAQITPQIKKLFGQGTKKGVPAQKIPKFKALQGPIFKIEPAEYEQDLAYIAFKIPSIKHKDIPALEVLASVLGQGDSSRLMQKMRIQSPLVNSVGSSLFSPVSEGLFVISMGYRGENFELALSALADSINEIKSGEISSDEIYRAIINIESDQHYGIETVDGLARRFGEAEFYFHDPKAYNRAFKKIKEVTAKDLFRVASKYLTPEGLTAAALVKNKGPHTRRALLKFSKKIASKSLAAKSRRIKSTRIKTKLVVPKLQSDKPRFESVQLSSGPKVLLYPSKATTVVSVRTALLGGAQTEEAHHQGLNELFGRVWMTETKNRTESEIYNLIERSAASFYPIAGRNSVGAALDCLKGFESEMADLFCESLLSPIFSNKILERERVIQLEQIKSKNDNPAQVCIRQFMQSMFPNHSYGRDPLGTEKTLNSLQASDLEGHYKKHFKKENITFSLAGNFDQDLWLERLDGVSSGLPVGGKQKWSLDISKITQPQKSYTEQKKEQSHLVLGFPSSGLGHPGRYALHLIEAILAGQGGRLFLELRDKNSLAYSVSPLRFEGMGGGYFGAYIGCAPDKVPKAIEMIQDEFERLTKTPVTKEEINRAKQYLVGKHNIDLQRTGAIASSLIYEEIYGLDAEKETFHIEKLYADVDPQKIKQVSQEIFTGPAVVSLVGPNKNF